MKKKLLFIAPANSIHSKKWIESFLSSDFDLYWISFYQRSIEINIDIKFYEINNNIIFSYFKLKKLLSEINPDVVNYHYLGFQLFLIPFLKIKNLITSPWGSDIKFTNKNSVKGFFINKIFKMSKSITVDADFMFDEVNKFGASFNSKIKRINYGTDVNFFKFKSKDKNSVFKIISLRNHEQIYDIDKLILALSIVIKKGYKVSLSIYGSGSQTESLKSLVKKTDLFDFIEFNGGYEYSKLPNLLHQYDLYVSTSTSDAGLSASTSEAMSSGVTVLTANNSENPYWMSDNCGFLFKTSSIEDLSTKIISIINMDHDAIKIIRLNARKKIEDYNDYNNEMTKMLNIYNSLLTKN